MKTILLVISVVILLACNKTDENIKIPDVSKTFLLNTIDNILFTKDNGLLITGSHDQKYTVIKTDLNLNIQWFKNNYDWGKLIFGSGWGSSFYSVKIVKIFPTNDGKYICAGSELEGGDVVFSSTLIIVLNRYGEQISKYKYYDMAVSNAIQTEDGYILFGNTVLKLDKNFSRMWSKEIYDGKYLPAQITSTSDGGFAITGSFNGEQAFLKKFDSNGNELLSRTYKHNEFPFEESGFDLMQLGDYGYLIVGRAGRTFIPNTTECQIIRTNSNGDTVCTKRFGPENSWIESILTSEKNEFVLQGNIGLTDQNQKSFLIKIDSEGQISDQASFDKFELIRSLPSNMYVKATRKDNYHIDISTIADDQLFEKK